MLHVLIRSIEYLRVKTLSIQLRMLPQHRQHIIPYLILRTGHPYRLQRHPHLLRAVQLHKLTPGIR